eukprot:4156485-Lingulodinium_polyedra.AAC.1
MEATVSQLLSSLEATAAKCLACIVDDIAPFIFVLGDEELSVFENEELESMERLPARTPWTRCARSASVLPQATCHCSPRPRQC